LKEKLTTITDYELELNINNNNNEPKILDLLQLKLKQKLSPIIAELASKNYRTVTELLEDLAFQYICKTFFVDLGWSPETDEEFTLASFIKENNLSRQHKKLILTLLRRLVQRGILIELSGTGSGRAERNFVFKSIRAPPSETTICDTIIDIQTILADHPEFGQEVSCIDYFGSYLLDGICGKASGLSILFPDETDTLKYPFAAKSLYENSYIMKSTKVVPATEGMLDYVQYLRNNKNAGDKIRILEIGGGTGGTTVPFFQAIASSDPLLFRHIHYTFTDISSFLVGQTKGIITSKFPDFLPNIEFTSLDIEISPFDQGFEPNSYDLILAADVFHATEFLGDTLDHTRALLEDDGLLVLGELFQSRMLVEISFGLTSGWWRWGDDIRTHSSPLLSPGEWDSLLKQRGFEDSFSVGDGTYGIIFAQADKK